MLLTRKRRTSVRGHKTSLPAPDASPALEGARIGRLASVQPSGVALVECEGVLQAPARAVIAAPPPGRLEDAIGRQVVLVFEANDPRRPIVIGWPQTFCPEAGRTLRVDGRRVRIEAEQEIELRCGDAAITLTADGRVRIEGRGLLSHARELNRIRGGQVKIN